MYVRTYVSPEQKVDTNFDGKSNYEPTQNIRSSSSNYPLTAAIISTDFYTAITYQ